MKESLRVQPARMNRKIAAILAADVAGYSRLVAADEEAALRHLVESQALFRERVAAHRGRVFNTAGDAILAEFPSAVEATRAALDIQREMSSRYGAGARDQRFQLRMGLNIGDVVEHGGDLLGDGVNVAARMQELSPAGGLAVSSWVREQISGKISLALRDIGRRPLKNIPAPVHVFVADIAPPVAIAAPVAAVSDASKIPGGRTLPIAVGGLIAAGLVAVGLAQLGVFAPRSTQRPAIEAGPVTAPPPSTPTPTGQPVTSPIPASVPPAALPSAAPPSAPAPTAPAVQPATIPAAIPPAALPPPVAPAPRATAPSTTAPAEPAAKSAKDTAADRKRSNQSCAEVLQRAQLGDLSAEDRAFLRSQCR